MGGEEACCGAGRQRGYILRIEENKSSQKGFLCTGRVKEASGVSEGGMRGHACDRIVDGPLLLGPHGRATLCIVTMGHLDISGSRQHIGDASVVFGHLLLVALSLRIPVATLAYAPGQSNNAQAHRAPSCRT